MSLLMQHSRIVGTIVIVSAVSALALITGCRVIESRRLVGASVPYEQTGTGPAVVIFGDSTAEGTGSSDPRESIAGRLGLRWPNTPIINRGRDGAKLADIAAQIEAMPTLALRLIVIMGGGNDIIAARSIADLESDLTRVLNSGKRLNAPMIFMGAGNVGSSPMFPWPVSTLVSHRARQAQAVFDRVTARMAVTRINLFFEPADDPFLTDAKRFFASDGLHPSGDGYGLWSEKLYSATRDLGG